MADDPVIDPNAVPAPVSPTPPPAHTSHTAAVFTIESLDDLPVMQELDDPARDVELWQETIPWERYPGETDQWFDRFSRYRRAGRMRSISQIWREERVEIAELKGIPAENIVPIKGSTPGNWISHAEKWEWSIRAGAWDAFIAAKDEAEWMKRRSEIRTREWDMAERLLKKAEEMLKFPLATVVRRVNDATGEAITEVKPARWDFNTVSTYLEQASKIARLAAELRNADTPLTVNQTFNTIKVRDLASLPAPETPTITIEPKKE